MMLTDRAHIVAGIANPRTVLLILHVIIDIDGRILHLSERLNLVDVGKARHETMSDELIRAAILVDDVYLPVQEVGRHLAVPAFPPHLIGRIGHALAVIEVFPAVNVHAPIVQSPATVEFLEVTLEFLLDIVAETLEIIGIVDVTGFHLIIHLIADDGRMLGEVLHHLADDTFAVTEIGRVLQIHVLPDAVVALSAIPCLR